MTARGFVLWQMKSAPLGFGSGPLVVPLVMVLRRGRGLRHHGLRWTYQEGQTDGPLWSRIAQFPVDVVGNEGGIAGLHRGLLPGRDRLHHCRDVAALLRGGHGFVEPRPAGHGPPRTGYRSAGFGVRGGGKALAGPAFNATGPSHRVIRPAVEVALVP